MVLNNVFVVCQNELSSYFLAEVIISLVISLISIPKALASHTNLWSSPSFKLSSNLPIKLNKFL